MYVTIKMNKQNSISKEVLNAKNALRIKYKKQGLNKDQMQIALNSLDCEFSTHSFVNKKCCNKSNTKERLKFYVDFLKMNL